MSRSEPVPSLKMGNPYTMNGLVLRAGRGCRCWSAGRVWCREPLADQQLSRGSSVRENTSSFFARRPEFAGVGPATAQSLWDTFGEELYRILGRRRRPLGHDPGRLVGSVRTRK
jgi:hypothetical protein